MSNQDNAVAKVENTGIAIASGGMQNAAVFIMENLPNIEKLASYMSKASLVPKHLQGKEADCMLVVMQAVRWGMDPFAVAQKTHVIEGTLGYEAQLVNAVVNTLTPTKGRIQYEWYGPWENVIGKTEEKTSAKGFKYRVLATNPQDEKGCGVKVWATLKGEEKPRELDLLLTQAITRNSTNWASDPKQQLGYLAVKKWVRLHAPEILQGVYTPDELEDSQPVHQSADFTQKDDKPTEMLPIGGDAVVEEVEAEAVNPETGEVNEPSNMPPSKEELAELKKLAWATGQIKTKDVYETWLMEAVEHPVPISPEALTREQYNKAVEFFAKFNEGK